jgi:hypothetical protein
MVNVSKKFCTVYFPCVCAFHDQKSPHYLQWWKLQVLGLEICGEVEDEQLSN